MKLVDKNHETIWTHIPDPEKKLNLKKAKKSCKCCYGTGQAGRLSLYDVRLVCKCVAKQTALDEKALAK